MSAPIPDIGADIADLKLMSIEDLRIRWRAIFAKRPPESLPKYLLVSMIAYDLQAREFGNLEKDQTRYLDAIYKNLNRAAFIPAPGQSDTGKFMIGTVFVREHAGMTHHVVVASEGFLWAGNVYSSLSAVARAITGTNWNGRRFFGLVDNRQVDQ
jgi:hypothetical protein